MGRARLMASLSARGGWLIYHPSTVDCIGSLGGDQGWAQRSDKPTENATPLHLDNENPTFGRYSAGCRVARTFFAGSAPVSEAANRGIDDRRIKLGCVQLGRRRRVS